MTIANWKISDGRFVAFLDILGFKDLVMRSTHDEIYDQLLEVSKLSEQINNWTDGGRKRYENAGCYTVSFSDSIILFSKSDSIEDFDLFTFSVGWLFARAIGKNVPLKGAIAYGEISINRSKQIYFGQPIIDAYLLQEEVNYFGIVAHHSLEQFYNKNRTSFHLKEEYKEFATPLKSGIISHLNLNWFDFRPKAEREIPIRKYILDRLEILKVKTSGAPRKYVENTKRVFDELYKE